MLKAYEIFGDTIVINRDLTDLDFFVKDFLDVIRKERHSVILRSLKGSGLQRPNIFFQISK